MESHPSLAALFRQWSDGNHAAAEELFARYSRRLAELAERNLSHRLAARVDGEDVAQSVFRTFFTRGARGDFRISSSAEIWQLLVSITLAKTRDQARRHTAERRNARNEAPGTGGDWLRDAVSSEPGPEDAAILVDQIESVLKGFPPLFGEILGLRMEGVSRTDIAERLEVSRQTVHRALKRMQERMHRLEGEAAES
jgi:RNA polymerase sigma-70 factor, ECF subfamily